MWWLPVRPHDGLGSEIARRPQANPHDRPARKRLHDAHQHHRAEHAAASAVARAEVTDEQRTAVGVVQDRLDHRGVAPVALLRACEIDQVDGEDSVR